MHWRHLQLCSTTGVNKHCIRVNMLGSKAAPLSFTLIPAQSESEPVHTEAYHAMWRALRALTAVKTCYLWVRWFLEGEVDGIVSILNAAQQISSGLHGQKFYSLFDKGFLLIWQVHIFVLVFAVVLLSVRIWNEENSCRGRCHNFRLTRAFAELPQWTSEDCVQQLVLEPLLVTHGLPVTKTP